jgi:hypothetical protein
MEMKEHSVEEIRAAMIEILTQNLRRDPSSLGGYYGNLKSSVGQHFQGQEPSPARGVVTRTYTLGGETPLSGNDSNLVLEVFWELVNLGVLCFQLEDLNRGQVVYRVTQRGREYLMGDNPYRFHDGASYAALFKSRIPNIHHVTLAYLNEAGQTYAMGCFLAAGVTLTVALEHALAQLFETIINSKRHGSLFASISEHRDPAQQLKGLLQILKTNDTVVSSTVCEDLETHLEAVVAIIRRFRDETGQPNGKSLSREDCTLLLQLFIPCCQKIYQLKEALS